MAGFGKFTARSAGLPERVEALDRAVDLATGRLDDETVAFGRHVVDKAGERLRHGTTYTLVAILGATGSGKSSVCNAVVGSDVATTGVRRPTTSSTLACFWPSDADGVHDTGDDVHPLLDWLEVKNRHRVSTDEAAPSSPQLGGLVLLDVPDHDSVAQAHREEMERIAEHADMLLWVTDPEKYADKAMHDYLRALAGHGPVITMVLNKTDTLTPEQVTACRDDLQRLLADAGLEQVSVLAVSANEGHRVDDLVAELAGTVKDRRAVTDRLAADTAMAANDLLGEIGSDGTSDSVDAKAADRLRSDLVEASGLSVVTEAVAAGYRRDAARRTGWPFTRWLRRLRPHPLRRLHLDRDSAGRATLPQPSGVQAARTAGAIRDVVNVTSSDLPPPWPTLVAKAGTPPEGELEDRINNAIAEATRAPGRSDPRWWAAVGGLQWLLAAAAIVGALWLAVLFGFAYLRLPEPPTPDYRGVDIPTGLLLGGLALGLLVALIASRVGAVGAGRRRRAVHRRAEAAVGTVTDELIIDPIEHELANRSELRRLLTVAKGGS
jgi:GTP-binding protein EngB required for normal cell division